MEKYKELRANDSGGVGRNSYRITVRQLESLIRLSEAIAKANCVEDVTEHMVIEAHSLLKMSIISVERDDVDVDDEEDAQRQQRDGDSPMTDAEGPQDGGAAGPQANGTPPPEQPRPRTKITFEKFSSMQHSLASHIRDIEDTTGEGIEHDELVLWYTEEIEKEGEIDSVETLAEETDLVRKVLKRMIKASHSIHVLTSRAKANFRDRIT